MPVESAREEEGAREVEGDATGDPGGVPESLACIPQNFLYRSFAAFIKACCYEPSARVVSGTKAPSQG